MRVERVEELVALQLLVPTQRAWILGPRTTHVGVGAARVSEDDTWARVRGLLVPPHAPRFAVATVFGATPREGASTSAR